MQTDVQEKDVAIAEEDEFDAILAVDRKCPHVFILAVEFVRVQTWVERVRAKDGFFLFCRVFDLLIQFAIPLLKQSAGSDFYHTHMCSIEIREGFYLSGLPLAVFAQTLLDEFVEAQGGFASEVACRHRCGEQAAIFRHRQYYNTFLLCDLRLRESDCHVCTIDLKYVIDKEMYARQLNRSMHGTPRPFVSVLLEQ